MDRRFRIGGWAVSSLVTVAIVVGLGVGLDAPAFGATSITKDEFLTKANAVCEQGNAAIEAAAAKLGDPPTKKQVATFVTKELVPNVAGQIAAIRKLGFPAADKAQLTALFAGAEKILARIKKDPSVVTGRDDPFEAVNQELSAYGLHQCAGDDPVSVVEEYAGTYTGTWTNTTFGSTGTIKLEISVDRSTRTMKVTTTLTGNVLGAPPPPPQTLTIPLGTAQPGQPVTVTSPVFGTLTIAVNADGTLVGDAPDVPGAAVNSFHAELKESATGLAGTYSVALASGTTARGTLTLQHA